MKRQAKTMARTIAPVILAAVLAALLQSVPGWLQEAGLLISPLATAPILLLAIRSLWPGLAAYVLATLLLMAVAPQEWFIFSFATGLMGLFLGSAFHFFERKAPIVLFGASALSVGTLNLLYILKYPILGPLASISFYLPVAAGVVLFTVLYCWLWIEILHAGLRFRGKWNS